jgi:NAD(P)-dependent dehydrogenase (short-subunit alcohol dehydrogenase family)/acyl carrier protein
LADKTNVGQTLADLLREQGQTVFLVYADEVYNNKDNVWHLNPASPTDFECLLKEIPLTKPLQGIVHLWSIDIASPDDSLDNTQILNCGSTLHLIQGILKQGLKPRLWFVTQGAVSIGDHPVSVAQASLWGLGRVVALEYPQLWGGMLDLPLPSDKTTTDDWAATILTEIWDAQKEDQLAFRSGQRYVARLAAFEHKAEAISPILHSDASYLITGGLGELGLQIARWLIKQGAKHLVLTGRRGATGKEALVDQLTQMGAKVKVVKADVANDVTKVMLEASMPPLRGIVHAAGLLDDGILLQQSWERFKNVMAPKIAGSWHLYTQTKASPLDFFVLFSSGTSLLGTAGQGSYAAANAFMDALAQHCQVQGLPFLSICWAGWDVGMAARLDKRHMQRGANRGISLIPPKEGLQVFGNLLNLLNVTSGQVGVLPIDWADFADNPLAQQAVFSNLIQSSQNEQIHILPQLEQALPDERVEILKNYLKTAVAKALGTDELPDARQGFFDMGMDSLIAVELSNQLQKSLNVSFPSTIIFEYPSVDALNEYLLNELLFLTEQQPVSTVSQKNELSEMKNLSKSDLENLIEQELAEILEMDK